MNNGFLMASPEMKRLAGLRLKAARLALGYDETRGRTQAAFYRLFSLSKGRGNNWERGIAYPNPDFMVDLYRRFEVGPDWILLERPGGLPDRIADQVVNNFRKIKSEEV